MSRASAGANTGSSNIAAAELSRIAVQLTPLLGSRIPEIGLFSWTQKLTGLAGEPSTGIPLADVARALGGAANNVVCFCADTWRQAEPPRDENGIEYRGVVAVDRNDRTDPHIRQYELKAPISLGDWGIRPIDIMREAGEALAKLPEANAALWVASPPQTSTRHHSPLIIWLSALHVLQERNVFTGNFVDQFNYWSVISDNRCQTWSVMPGADGKDLDGNDIDTTRRVAVVREPVRASLQLIDWVEELDTHDGADGGKLETDTARKSPGIEERALAMFFQHTGYTKKQIADALGCHEKSLAPGRCPKLAAAIAAHKTLDLPQGSKDADGNMQAWDQG